MAFSLFPKNIRFFDYFLQQHSLVVLASKILTEIFTDFTDLKGKCSRINQIEVDGNTLAREISRSLSMTFITPIDREDIYAICTELEEMLDLIQSVSTRVGLYGFHEAPASTRELVRDLELIIASQEEMIRFISTRTYHESVMNGILEACADGRRLLVVSLGELFEKADQGQLDFAEAIKLSQIYDRLEMLFNHAQKLSFTLEKAGIKSA
ncbi:MAG: DUF47 family protein [Deltaproteobacteria bacterium]|nr:DUF47 family protein [Deltaproteobacteria bacterium]